MSQSSVAGLLTQLTNNAALLMVVDAQQTAVDESAITPILNAFEATGLVLNDDDFATVINALTANIDDDQASAPADDTTVHYIAMMEFFSFALLVKIGVLNADLTTTEGHFEVKQILEDLASIQNTGQNTGQSVEKPPAGAPSAPPLIRRRTTRRRTPVNGQPNVQQKSPQNKVEQLNSLTQLAQDSLAFDERFILEAIKLVSKQLNDLYDESTSPALEQTITALVTEHHQYKQLLATHVNRSGLLFNALIQAEQLAFATVETQQEQTERLKQWLAKLTAPNDIEDVQQLIPNYLLSRGRIDGLLAKMKGAVDNTLVKGYLPAPTLAAFEAGQTVGELLSKILSNIADLASAHWQTLSNNHTSQDLTNNQTFNCHALKVFNQTQSYKTQLLSLVVSIDKIGDKLHQEIDKSVKGPAVLELIHGLGGEIALMLANDAPCSAGIDISLPKATFAEGNIIIETDTMTLSTALHCLMVDFERLKDGEDDSISQQTLDELRRHSDITLNCVIKAMDETGNNYLQLITLLRAQNQPQAQVQSQINKKEKPEINVNSLQNSAPDLALVTHEIVNQLCQNGPMLMQGLENGGALNASLQILARLDPAAKFASLSEILLPLEPNSIQQCFDAMPSEDWQKPATALAKLLPIIDQQTTLITLCERTNKTTEQTQDWLTNEAIITVDLDEEQTNMSELMHQYMAANNSDETFGYAQKIILHSPQQLLIDLNRQSETEVVIDTQLTIDTNRFELGGFICSGLNEGLNEEASNHYYSYLKIEQQWYLCDDLNVKEIMINELLVAEQSQVVLVLYNAVA
jgi:hypothetical protein